MQRRLRPGATRTACSPRSSGRPTATACSTSATSSVTATGSTASGRATACSCPASSSSRWAASTRASRCRAAGTPTSSSTSGSGRRPTSPFRRSSAKVRFTRCTAAPRPTTPDADERQQPHRALRPAVCRDPRSPVPGPGGTMHFVGSMPPGAVAHQGPRRSTPNLFKAGAPDPDGCPSSPSPIPEELRTAFLEAFWRSHAWRHTTWLGTAGGHDRRPTWWRTRSCSRVRPAGSWRPAPAPAAGPCSSPRSASSSGTGRSCRSTPSRATTSRAPAHHLPAGGTRHSASTARQVARPGR